MALLTIYETHFGIKGALQTKLMFSVEKCEAKIIKND